MTLWRQPHVSLSADEAGFLAWIPFLYPSVGTDAVEKAAAGLGFIGGLVFEAGAYLMVVEALDRYVLLWFGCLLLFVRSGWQATPLAKKVAVCRSALVS